MSLARPFAWLAALLCFAGVAFAQEAVRDPRLRVVAYDAGQVVEIEGHLGYQMMIAFSPHERIENVSIGDSVSWQVSPNRAATLLFLKPTAPYASTNMTVVTNQRRYAFSLRSGEADGPDDPRIMYSLQFVYPEEETAEQATPAPVVLNFDYMSSGASALTPLRVFDDGRFTYFQMPAGSETPAIFVLNAHGEEEVVNSQVRGGFTVVDLVADAFVLRFGRDRALVQRSGFEQVDSPVRSRRLRRGRAS